MLRGILMLSIFAVIVGGMSIGRFSPETFDRFIPSDGDGSLPPAVMLGELTRGVMRSVGEQVVPGQRQQQIEDDLNDPKSAAKAFEDMTAIERLLEADSVVREAKAGFAAEEQRRGTNGASASRTTQPAGSSKPREDPIHLQIVKLIEASPDKYYLSAKLTEWTSQGMRDPEVLKRFKEHERAREETAQQ